VDLPDFACKCCGTTVADSTPSNGQTLGSDRLGQT
jgi:hypothetical protein